MKPHPFSLLRARCVGWMGCVVLALYGCSSAPPTPGWQVEAKDSMDRALNAYLEGNNAVQRAEMRRVRAALARTGRPQALAQAELLLCAAQTAALDFSPCSEFDALQPDVSDAQRSYAAYLAGASLAPAEIEHLPQAQRPVARRSPQDASALPAEMEPLPLLVAASNLMRRAQCPSAVVDQAIDTASAQGWRRPLMAWIGVKRQIEHRAGHSEAVEHLDRRLKLLQTPPR